MLQYTIMFGTAYTLPLTEGVICWLHPGQTDVTIGRVIRSGLYMLPRWMGLSAYLRFNSYLKLSERLRKENTPDKFWYLWVIGVDPSCQGKGIGGKLIRPILERADAEGAACYLETESEKNLDFYKKHLFQIKTNASVPGSDLMVWSMRRDPVRNGSGDPRKIESGNSHLP
jgi:ribosomal protein S18 acetylase RimI-like enzyme